VWGKISNYSAPSAQHSLLKVWHSLDSVDYSEQQLVLALGNFDGLHRGHQELLKKLVWFARQEGKTAGVLLFNPHPQQFLNPAGSPKLLQDLDQKLEILASLGIEAAFVIPFDNGIASLSPEEFVKTILVQKLKVAGVFAGFNYRFGRQAAGTPERLKSYGEHYGFKVTVIPPVYVDGTLVSSTAVRAALDAGAIDRSHCLLDRWPVIKGVVAPGDKRGRLIGFPTANVATGGEVMIPCAGVYAGSARVVGHTFTTVVNIGFRPTFVNSSDLVIEAYLVQFKGSIYGEGIEIELFKRLRGERRFESPEALVLQIEQDIRDAVSVERLEVKCGQ
jgi:riboflavin kinase/FMN adenylyltransferase